MVMSGRSSKSHARTQDGLHTRALFLGQSFRHVSANRTRRARHEPCCRHGFGLEVLSPERLEVLSPERKEAWYEPEQEAGAARVAAGQERQGSGLTGADSRPA